jgi:hypothetical protein
MGMWKGEGMDIGEAVEAMKNGARVRRTGWAGERNWWTALAFPGDGRTVTDWPFFVKHWTDGTVAWAPTHDDLLAEDWELVGVSRTETGQLDEPDEDPADVQAAYERGTKGWTGIR